MANVQTIAGQQSLSLGNEEYLRKFAFGTAWTYLRVAIHYGVTMSGSLAAPQLVIGVNSGTQFGFRSNNCVEFIGLQLTNAGSAGFTFTAGTPNYFSSGMFRFHYKVGAVDTLIQANATGTFGPITPTRGLFIVDMLKQATSFNMAYFYAGVGATAQFDVTTDYFIRLMERDAQPPTYPGNGGFGTLISPYTGPFSFDSFSVSWNDNVNTLDIASIMVARYY